MSDPKSDSLQSHGALNPRPEEVADELFREHPFFDPRDLVQVRYEMLRRVRLDGESISACTRRFGVTRPTWYRAARAFDAAGLAGLVPARPGPRSPRKLSAEIVDELAVVRRRNPRISHRRLAELACERFGVRVHRRSVERALSRQKK